MSAEFPESPLGAGHDALLFDLLVIEQTVAQEGKPRDRSLSNYSAVLFRDGIDYLEAGYPPTPLLDLLGEGIDGSQPLELPALLAGLAERRGRGVHWVDMGAGYAVAMRQLGAQYPETARFVDMSAVDVHYPDLLASPAAGWPKEFHSLTPPAYLQADMSQVVLPKPADLITSIESWQYVDDPLAVLCHWYNLLADDGILFITAYNIAERIQFVDQDTITGPVPALMDALQQTGITCARNAYWDVEGSVGRWKTRDNFIGSLAIKKRAGTSLRLQANRINTIQDSSGFKHVRYEPVGGGVILANFDEFDVEDQV